jgi:hypothetical protein
MFEELVDIFGRRQITGVWGDRGRAGGVQDSITGCVEGLAVYIHSQDVSGIFGQLFQQSAADTGCCAGQDDALVG